MPGWLVRATRVRAVELVGEFLRRAGETPLPAEALRLSCDIARQMFEADGVILWTLDPARTSLAAVAASPPQEEFFGELAVDALPECRQALADGMPRWVQLAGEGERSSLPPLIDARCALLLPVATQGSTGGCFLCLFARGTPVPAPEELEAGLALGCAVGQILAVETLARERCAQQQRRDAQLDLAREFDRWGWSEAGLSRLTATARELCGAEVVAVYEQQPTAYARIAVAGPAHLLPTELPRGLAEVAPGSRAAENRAVSKSVDDVSGLLKASFPHSPHTRLRLLPLRSQEFLLGAVLLRGAAGQTNEELEVNLLSLLTAGLENRRLERQRVEDQRRHQALFERCAEGVFYLDVAGRLLAASARLLARTGHSLEPLRAWLAARPGRDYRAQVRWRTKAGQWWPLELVLHALPATPPGQAAILGLARDAPPQPEPDTPAQLSRAWLQGVLDSSND
ncbi:MAG: hypothetical protein ACE5HB_10420, partial [Terriglobia bacterium]